MPAPITPGVYDGMPFADYLDSDGVSNSRLGLMGRSALHYRAAVDKDTDAKRAGRMVHKAVLEPEAFEDDFTVIPADAPRKPSISQRNAKNPSAATLDAIAWWDEFDAAHQGVEIITPEQRCKCFDIRDAVWSHPEAARILSHEGPTELSVFAYDEPTGLMRRVRPDKYIPEFGVIVDLKKTRDASPAGFAKSVFNYRYHVQAPYYLDTCDLVGLDARGFVFIAVEEEPPHAVGVYTLEPEAVDLGRRTYRAALDRVSECTLSRQWPGYTTKIETIGLPPWAYKQAEEQIR